MANRSWLSLSVLACIGCCALPFIIGAAGGIAAVMANVWVCGGVLVVAGLVWYVMRRRRMARENIQCCGVNRECKQS